MTNHGAHTVHPAQRMVKLCLQYPWSVLWVLATAGIASLIAGEYIPVAIIVILSTVITVHSIHRDRVAETKADRRK